MVFPRLVRSCSLTVLVLSSFLLLGATATSAQTAGAGAKKPNIVVIFGDDVGYWNISAYNQGMMGYKTPNIDRIAHEGALFTDYYAQQSCTAGRAAFITGQSPIRTGLTKVGLPGADLGLQKEDPTLAELLKAQGYLTFQHGKNHLGDRNEFLPTVHGFDEFYGNLYHLNAEEEPENLDYPKTPAFGAKFGPRGVLKCKATATDNPAPPDPRFGPWGKQTCEDTGPLTKKRMETADDEFLTATVDAMDRAVKEGKPFFIWHNTTRMHIWTHLEPKYQDMIPDKGFYGAGMTELDDNVGVILKKIQDLGIADNTIVIFSSDNGAETFSWPDGGTTPFRGEKNTSWEGGYRVPFLIRWPGTIKPGTIVNDIGAHEDWVPTLMSAAGAPGIKDKLLKGYPVGGMTYKVHLDGYDWSPYFKSEIQEGPRKEFLYWTDDGDLAGLRYNKWKLLFSVQRAHGFGVWQEPFVQLRVPMLVDLHADPFERAEEEGADYVHWRIDRIYLLVPAQAFVGQWLQSFREFPPRQKPASFSLDQVMQEISRPQNGDN
jgi:arylsulfatase A-like enzyme